MIDRRSTLKAAAAMSAMAAGLAGRNSRAQTAITNDWQEQARQARAAALAAFPFERREVRGDAALQEWERLKSEGRGTPVLIGGDDALDGVVAPFHPRYATRVDRPGLADTLARADRLSHSEGLLELKRIEEQRFEELLRTDPNFAEQYERFREQLREAGIDPDYRQPPVGDWPAEPPGPVGLTVAQDWLTGRPLDSVHLVLIPTDDWTTVPAHLRWGGWNANPPPEYHVAALRSWRDRFGAELVGMAGDILNIRVAHKPTSREEALALAQELYAYCPDTIDQGVGTQSNLAAFLLAHDWWFFWWD